MKISSFNPMIKSVHNQAFMSARREFNNLSPLTQDTISFGSSASTRKLVEELKQTNTNGIHTLSFSDVEKVYKYFGFKRSDEGHVKFTGPYGQYAKFKKQNPVDVNTAKDLIRSLKYVDELHGELVTFEKEPTREEIELWKKRIEENTPNIGFVNEYAVDNKERLAALHEQEEPEIDSTKEQEKAVNRFKIELSSTSAKLEKITEDFEATQELFEETKQKAITHKIELPQNTLDEVDKKIKKKGQEIAAAKDTIENYDKKLNKGIPLTEEESEKVNSYQNLDNDLSSLFNEVIEIEQICTTGIENQNALIENILSAIKKFENNAELLRTQSNDIKNIIDEASTYANFKRSLINKLYSLHASLEEKLSKISEKVESYAKVETQKEPISKLKTILNKINEYNNGGLGNSLPELIELNKIIENEITPIITFSEDDKKAKSLDRIEKFNQKVEQAQSHRKADTPKQIKPEPKPQVIEQMEIQLPEEPVILETTPIEQKLEISPEERTIINLLEEKTQKFKSKLIDNIIPIGLDSVRVALAKLVDANFDAISLSKVNDNNTTAEKFTLELTRTIAKTPEFNRLKNAARFAFLNSVYKSSTNKQSEIFALDATQTKYVFEAIKNGQREIEVQTDTTPITISLPQDYDLNDVNPIFEKYNTKTSEQKKEIEKRIVAEILKYAPNFSEEELHPILMHLSQDGSYYELLTNDDCNKTLRTTLLTTFWKNYDKVHGTNFESQVLQNLDDEEKKIKAAEMQKRKLESIKKMDWSL